MPIPSLKNVLLKRTRDRVVRKALGLRFQSFKFIFRRVKKNASPELRGKEEVLATQL